eukprot:CAMPEP_0179873288 /NCGR_PEP_ID=MMETSP0982-20121206/22093_1 /TAXON_ID=483367 /ORGANISM="non described non described, Strain CCMP 2436" /LENGTH=93 /DNA_ID=CAMNT_0021764643 /DNA_START=450 /DNA_END=731 /DNA_ORIENTATION=+
MTLHLSDPPVFEIEERLRVFHREELLEGLAAKDGAVHACEERVHYERVHHVKEHDARHRPGPCARAHDAEDEWLAGHSPSPSGASRASDASNA